MMVSRWKEFPLLKRGERVRFDDGIWEVVRVTPGAAYLRSAARRSVTVTDRKSGEERTFEAQEARVVAISPRSFIERVSE